MSVITAERRTEQGVIRVPRGKARNANGKADAFPFREMCSQSDQYSNVFSPIPLLNFRWVKL